MESQFRQPKQVINVEVNKQSVIRKIIDPYKVVS